MTDVKKTADGLPEQPGSSDIGGEQELAAALAAVQRQIGEGTQQLAGAEMAEVPSAHEAQREAGAPLDMPERTASEPAPVALQMSAADVAAVPRGGEDTLHDLAEEQSAATAGAALTGAAVGAGVTGGMAYLAGTPLLGSALTGIGGLASGIGLGAAAGAGLHYLGRHYHYTARRGKPRRGILGTMFVDAPVGLVMTPFAALRNLGRRTFGR